MSGPVVIQQEAFCGLRSCKVKLGRFGLGHGISRPKALRMAEPSGSCLLLKRAFGIGIMHRIPVDVFGWRTDGTSSIGFCHSWSMYSDF